MSEVRLFLLSPVSAGQNSGLLRLWIRLFFVVLSVFPLQPHTGGGGGGWGCINKLIKETLSGAGRAGGGGVLRLVLQTAIGAQEGVGAGL